MKAGRESKYEPNTRKESLHQETNDNGLQMVQFSVSRNMVIGGIPYPQNIYKGT
jgi:hypothetical protein